IPNAANSASARPPMPRATGLSSSNDPKMPGSSPDVGARGVGLVVPAEALAVAVAAEANGVSATAGAGAGAGGVAGIAATDAAAGGVGAAATGAGGATGGATGAGAGAGGGGLCGRWCSGDSRRSGRRGARLRGSRCGGCRARKLLQLIDVLRQLGDA